ncbi:MAG: hypothetical protein ACLGSD_10845 [Acidobacteriota bacterium]
MKGVLKSSGLLRDGVAGLVGDLEYLKPLSAESEHFGHKWHAFELAMLIESAEYLPLAPHFDPVAHF